MGYIDGERRFINVEASAPLKGKKLAELVAAVPTLDCVQIEQSERARLPPGLIATLAEHVFGKRPEIQLRIYMGDELDLSFLADLPMLQNLQLEVSTRIDNVAALASCKGLKALTLTLPKSTDPNLLAHVATTVEELNVGPDSSAFGPLDLLPLARLQRLRRLRLHGYEQQLATVLASLPRLQVLSLRAMSRLDTVESLGSLSALHSVTMQRCGFANLDVLTHLPKLRYLQLWWMQKLASIDFVSRLVALEGLFFETLGNVKAFPNLTALRKLQVVKLATMAALRDFSAFEKAPRLQEFVFQRADRQRPTDFEPVLRNKALKRGGFGFHKKIDVQTMTALLAKHRIDGEVYMYPQLRGSYKRLQ
jgi:hypothetical protein